MSRIAGKFIVHIGQGKCGSTALQRFLHANNKSLSMNGYDYPEPVDKSPNHRILALWMLDQWMPLPSGPRFANIPYIQTSYADNPVSPIERLQSQIDQVENTHILSSEGLYDLPPSEFSRYFTPKNTKIILYVREQLDYLLSAYAQVVHSRKYASSFEEFLRRNWMLDYAAKVNEWSLIFGSENVVPRIYDRDVLIDGDICNDFLSILNITDMNIFSYPALEKSNPSIGGPLLKFKLLLNSVTQWDERRLAQRTYKCLQALAAQEEAYRSRVPITNDLARKVRESYEKSNIELFCHYFSSVGGFKTKSLLCNEENDELSAEDFEKICTFMKEYPSKDRDYHSDNVIDAHYLILKDALHL